MAMDSRLGIWVGTCLSQPEETRGSGNLSETRFSFLSKENERSTYITGLLWASQSQGVESAGCYSLNVC